jgi:putative SOS response-associated peptidase YedK
MGAKRFPLLNLQSEKITNLKDFAKRRCIIPAYGFYDWKITLTAALDKGCRFS